MTERSLSAVVLAAGEGTRMRSSLPKPLHPLCGRPMVLHVLHAVADLGVDRAVVVVGHGADRVTRTLREQAPPELVVEFVEQRVQRGTGDAVAVALTAFPPSDGDDGGDGDGDGDDDGADLLVLPGDTPLVRSSTLAAMVDLHQGRDAAATVLTARLEDPSGYGRVVRGADGGVVRVVEHADATDDELAVDEINTSVYCFRRALLAPALRRMSPVNAQGEYYLPDTLQVLHEAGHRVMSLVAPDPGETAGVNDRSQLAVAEAELRRRINAGWMRKGVTMVDPGRTYVDVGVSLERDVTLLPGTMLQGATAVGEGATIGPDSRLTDCTVGRGAEVVGSVGRSCQVGEGAVVGPFAVLDPGSEVAPGTVTGAFFLAPAPPDAGVADLREDA